MPARAVRLMLAIPAVALIIAVAVQNFALYQGVDFHGYGMLLNHQQAKLASPGPVDTVFLGDSSLGNAISTDVWQQETGKPALNLALIGYLGYGGSYHMARRVIEGSDAQTLVIMQNILLPTYGEQYESLGALTVGGAFSGPAHGPVDTIRAWLAAYLNLKTLKRNINGISLWVQGRAENKIVGDYVRQGPRLDPVAERARINGVDPLSSADIKPSHFAYLQALADLCRSAGRTCLYLHGPVFEARCQRMGNYLAAVNRQIAATGLTLVSPDPVCIPDADLGDTENHIVPARKPDYTRRYLTLLRPYLTRGQ